MLKDYRKHVAERAQQSIPPVPLNAEQTSALVECIKNPPAGEEDFSLYLLKNRIPAGVDEAAYVKAGFLAAITKSEAISPLIDKKLATELLGTMLGGYNIQPLIECLDIDELAPIAATALSHTLLIFDAFHDVEVKSTSGNVHAKKIIQSWADGEWFTVKKKLEEKITVTVFKVTGEEVHTRVLQENCLGGGGRASCISRVI